MKKSIEKLICPMRLGNVNAAQRKPLDEYLSDHSYIVFCTAFRRLQQKAQVFSLETDSAIRSRLTHSLEVADTGRRLATSIANDLKTKAEEKDIDEICIAAIVENTCLLHDIGNPPFGHFGEIAIQKWSNDHGEKILKKAMNIRKINNNHTKVLLSDFINFDGNPQGIRTLIHLNGIQDQGLDGQYGLNLTIQTILSVIKYPSHKKIKDSKKIGYFYSELDDIKFCCEKIGWTTGKKFPLMCIMEAADHICYALSDISDGIEKGVITLADFCRDLFEEIKISKDISEKSDIEGLAIIEILESYKRMIQMSEQSKQYINGKTKKPDFKELDEFINKLDDDIEKNGSDFVKICRIICYNSHREANLNQKNNLNNLTITLCRYLMKVAKNNYISNYDKILNASSNEELLFPDKSRANILLNSIKKICRKDLYRSYEAEKVEISGYRVITGLLNHFSILLTLSSNQFKDLLTLKNTGTESNELKLIKHDTELRVLSRVSNNALNTYTKFLKLYNNDHTYYPFKEEEFNDVKLSDDEFEWWLRFHMIIDHISGMTDRFALETYQMFEGININ
ncbi:MAG: dNTP triphosphohydrolase [Ruminococcus sp.]|jgi:dGTPase|nr:dNTP triphosphohydrolase [Ruminococcus sp.]